LQLHVTAISKSGDLLESIWLNDKVHSNYFTYDGNMRDPLKPVNMDEGVVLDLNNIKDEVATILLAIRLPDIHFLAEPKNQSLLKYSSYGLEYYGNALPISKESLANVKLEELVQAPENPDDPNQPTQSVFVFCYAISYRPEFGGWYLETLNCSTKGKTEPQ